MIFRDTSADTELSSADPANDDLRKAAEEAVYCLRLMAEFHFRGKSESAECHRLADNLLDALDGLRKTAEETKE